MQCLQLNSRKRWYFSQQHAILQTLSVLGITAPVPPPQSSPQFQMNSPNVMHLGYEDGASYDDEA